jgi:hypothetical protein
MLAEAVVTVSVMMRYSLPCTKTTQYHKSEYSLRLVGEFVAFGGAGIWNYCLV